MSKHIWILITAFGLALQSIGTSVAQVTYTFSTGANPFGAAGGVIDSFASTSFVSGTFVYNPAAPQTGTSAEGAAVYGNFTISGNTSSSVTMLNGSVQGLSFSDIRARAVVGNELPSLGSTVGPVDFLTLNAELTLFNTLVGFNIGGFTLVNVRLFWLEGQLGITDFLENQSLPAALPTFRGRLALDFVPTGTTGPVNPNHTAFFDGLIVEVLGDTQAPVLALPANLVTDATSPLGATVNYTVTATDNSGVTPTVSCIPLSGVAFAIGTTTVNCTATDAAGNQATGSFTVTVNGAVEQLSKLIAVVGVNTNPFGITNSLDTKLQHAINALDAMKANSVGVACNSLRAFINEAQAQSGKNLTVTGAIQLTEGANRVRAVLGCP